MNTTEQKMRILELTIKALDGGLLPEEFQELKRYLSSSKSLAEYYSICIKTHLGMRKVGSSYREKQVLENSGLDEEFWQTMLLHEKTSPGIDISKEEPERELLQKVIHKKIPRKINKFSLVSGIMSVAAILLLVIWVKMPSKNASALGRIEESYEVVWGDSYNPAGSDNLLDDQERFLKKGLVKVRMNDGTAVLLEGPIQFKLEQDDLLYLLQGKMTARVPTGAMGFTVRTPSASIVDYGTEFGVFVDQRANTEAFVSEGQVEMRLGSNTRVFEKCLRLLANQGGRVSGQKLIEIPFSSDQFTYEIPSSFELTAKSLDPILYFHGTNTNPDCARDLIESGSLSVQISSDVTMTDGPVLADGTTMHAFRLEGSKEDILMENIQSLLQHPQGYNSIGFWIRFDSIHEQVVFADNVNTGDNRILMMNSQGRLEHYVLNAGTKGRKVVGQETLLPNIWYFVMITRSKDQQNHKSLYVNGKKVGSDIIENMNDYIRPYQSLQFGGDIAQLNGMEGAISEILLFPRSLSDQEVELLYQSRAGSQEK